MMNTGVTGVNTHWGILPLSVACYALSPARCPLPSPASFPGVTNRVGETVPLRGKAWHSRDQRSHSGGKEGGGSQDRLESFRNHSCCSPRSLPGSSREERGWSERESILRKDK